MRNQVRTDQIRWLGQQRNACGAVYDCLIVAMTDRVGQLDDDIGIASP